MPPRIITVEIANLSVTFSETNSAPPSAAIIGTNSCTTAACVDDSLRRAAYQIVYPIAEERAPDSDAKMAPLIETRAVPRVAIAKTATAGSVRTKLYVVSMRGFFELLPFNV